MGRRMPKRVEGLVVEHLGAESLVFDPKTKQVHVLNPTTAFVLERCDGRKERGTAARDLEQRFVSRGGADLVAMALAELQKAGVIVADKQEAPSRREFAVRWGKVAAALPIVASIVAPTPAMAGSVCINNAPGTPGGSNPCNFNNGVSCSTDGSACTTLLCATIRTKKSTGSDNCTTDPFITPDAFACVSFPGTGSNFICATARSEVAYDANYQCVQCP